MSLNRRDFFKLGGTGAVVAAAPRAFTQSTLPATVLEPLYPVLTVLNMAELVVNQPVPFNYPDTASPCQLIKMGREVPGGIGPDHDIVAYSILCPHMGCPTQYDAVARSFKCGCHFSVFDPEMEGQQVCGQATQNMPRVALRYNANQQTIDAVGVHGLIYGRQTNVF